METHGDDADHLRETVSVITQRGLLAAVDLVGCHVAMTTNARRRQRLMQALGPGVRSGIATYKRHEHLYGDDDPSGIGWVAPARAYRLLLLQGITTIESLLRYTPRQLLAFSGFGEQSLLALVDNLSRRGQRLAQDVAVVRRYDKRLLSPPPRHLSMMQMRAKGCPLWEIGRAHGISRERVRQILKRWEKR